MLRVLDLRVAYGTVEVLHGVGLHVRDGEFVTLVGANGAGKSTTLKTISGLLRPAGGKVEFDGQRLDALPAHRVAELGIAHVPEGRRVFPEMTVRENLELGSWLPAARSRRKESLEWVFHVFPRLKERAGQLGGTLSGGEQQMLAIGRGLMLRPKLMMLDEPSLGLAPLAAAATFESLQEIRRQGVSILLVEQNVLRALTVADRGYVLESGRIVLEDRSDALLKDEHVRAAYLGL